MTALALLAALAAGQIPIDGPLLDGPASSGASANTSTFYALLTNSGDLPACSADTNCKLDVTAVANSDGGTWVTASLSDAGTFLLSNPGANGFEDGPMTSGSGVAVKVAKDITDGTAPYISAADAQTILGTTFYSSDFTVMCAANPTALSGSNPYVLAHGLASTDGFLIGQATSTAQSCRWNTSGAAQAVTGTTGTLNKWSVITCGKNGANYLSRVNGAETTAAVATTASNPSTRDLKFGRYDSVGFAIRGSFGRCRFYNTALSSTVKALREAQFLEGRAIRPADTYVTTVRASPSFQVYAGGYIHASGDNVSIPTDRGVASFSTATNAQTNALAICSMSLGGTGSCASNQLAGPYSRYAGGDEAETLTDSDGAARYNAAAGSAGTAAGAYTTAVFVKPGTLSAGALRLVQPGPGNFANCEFSGLGTPSTATISNTGTGTVLTSGIYCADGKLCSAGGSAFAGGFVRIVCGGTTATAGAGVVPALLLGAGADQGTLHVSGFESYAAAWNPPPFAPITTAIAADVHTVPTTGWPTTSGEIAVTYTPGDTATFGVNRGLLDSRTTATTQGVLLFRATDNRIEFRTYAGALTCTAQSAVLGVGTWSSAVVFEARWTPTTCEVLANGTSVATGVATGSPASHASTAFLGALFGSTGQANGWLKNLCVGRQGACP